MYTILHQHRHFVAIDKAPGISVHRDDQTVSLIDTVRKTTGIDDLHPVHRLDKMTSGLLLYAVGTANARELGLAFEHGLVEKYYLAISDFRPKKKQGAIVGDMAATRGGSYKLTSSRDNPARTRFFSSSAGEGLRLFILRPLTGRTHQLRVALKSLGSPIIGDERYGGTPSDRGYLHAYAIRFLLDGESHSLICPPRTGSLWRRETVVDVLAGYAKPWLLDWPG